MTVTVGWTVCAEEKENYRGVGDSKEEEDVADGDGGA